MFPSFRKLQHQKALHLDLLGDCIVLFVASFVAAKPAGALQSHWMVALAMGCGSILLWTLAARVLRHYDASSGRGPAGDIALTALQIIGLFLVLGFARYLVPH